MIQDFHYLPLPALRAMLERAGVEIAPQDGSFLQRGGETVRIRTRPCPAMSEMTLSTTSPNMFTGDEWQEAGLFLRTAEFLWQEGHTAHETAEEAMEAGMAGLREIV